MLDILLYMFYNNYKYWRKVLSRRCPQPGVVAGLGAIALRITIYRTRLIVTAGLFDCLEYPKESAPVTYNADITWKAVNLGRIGQAVQCCLVHRGGSKESSCYRALESGALGCLVNLSSLCLRLSAPCCPQGRQVS